MTSFKVKQITPEAMAEAFKKAFGRSFVTRVSEKDGKVIIQAEQRDTGQDIMTVDDVAALLQMERETIQQWSEAKAQSLPGHIPCFRIGKALRFSRARIIAWLEERMAAGEAPPVLPPVKGKVKKVKPTPKKPTD